MQENLTQNHVEPDRRGGFIRDLKQVAEKDYWATQLLLHEIYGRGFNPNQFNEIVNGLKALQEMGDPNLREKLIEGVGEDLPEFVKDFHHTIKLYFEIGHEVQKSTEEIYSGLPVAFAVNNKKNLEKDLGNLTFDAWIKAVNDPELKNLDAKCEKLFLAYWGKLKTRARVLKKLQGEPDKK